MAAFNGPDSTNHFYEEQLATLLFEHDNHVALEVDPFRTAMSLKRAGDMGPDVVAVPALRDSAVSPVGRVAKSVGLTTVASDGRPDSFFDDAERILVREPGFKVH